MNCRKCGNLLNENDTYCKICGEVVSSGADVNQGTAMQNPNPQAVQQVNQPVQQPVQQPVEQSMPQQPVMQQPVQQPQQVVSQPMQQQVPNMQQPMYGMPNQNMMNQGVMQAPTPKKNNLFTILIIILLIAILGLGSFIGYKALTKYDNKVETNKDKDKEKETDKDKDEDKDKDKDKDKEPEKPVVADNKNVYESNGYKFVVPSDLKYQIEDGILTFSDSTTFQTTMAADYYPYDGIVADQTSIITEIQTTGFQVVDKAEFTVGNRKFYLFQVAYNGQYAIFYFTKLDDYYSAIGLIIARVSEGYDKALEYVAKMIDNSNKTTTFAPGENEPTEKPKLNIDTKLFENSEMQGVEYPIKK